MGVLGKPKYMISRRNGKTNTMSKKKAEVFYIIEENVTVTVTVYVFYGKW